MYEKISLGELFNENREEALWLHSASCQKMFALMSQKMGKKVLGAIRQIILISWQSGKTHDRGKEHIRCQVNFKDIMSVG